MRKATIITLMLGISVLCIADTAASAEARRVWVRAPRGSCGIPDYYIVPRYCYDPRDDRVDTGPTAKPVVPARNDYGGTGGSGW